MYEKELQNLGLSEKEAKVYLTSLELGPDTVQNIAKQAGVNRATAYVQIDALKKKGLMSEFDKGKKTYFTAESPEVLSRIVDKEEIQLNFKKLEAIKLIPELSKFFIKSNKGSGRPKISFFEGEEGITQIREDFLKLKNETILGIFDADKIQHKLAKIQQSYSKRRIANKINSKALYTSKRGVIESLDDPKKLRRARLLPKSPFGVGSDITIYQDKVAYISYGSDSIGIIIKSKEIADTMRTIFTLLWNTYK